MPDEEAWALAQRGRAEAMRGDVAAAATFAAAADRFAMQANDVGEAAVLLARAELALSRGDGNAALADAARAGAAFAVATQAGGCAKADVTGAEALLLLGRAEEAHAAFGTLLQNARAGQQLQLQVQCLTGRGLAAQVLGCHHEASDAFEAAIALFEEQRRALPDDAIRSAFLADHLRPYQAQLRSAVLAGIGANVLWQLDRFRARALDERLAERREFDADDDADASTITATGQHLREHLNWLYRRAQQLQDEGSHSAVVSAEVQRTERELLERARRQRLALPQRDDPAAGEAFSAAALQHALQEGDALIEYGVLDDELFACVATPDGVSLHRGLASWQQVKDAVRSARFQIESLSHGKAPVERHLEVLTERARVRMTRLHALVWAPLAELLTGSRRVLVVPHAELGALPFAALHDGTVALGERHALAIAPSARLALHGMRRSPVPARRAVALGDST
ncbi:MAG: CHAT domain-containing protein, partial [Pseudomonadota bacterium]|nr:CHAT domain-containing protein [Pseudomonadota bacterium]